MNGAEENDGRFDAGAGLSKEMDALDLPLFKRLARGKDGGHGRVPCCKSVEVIHVRLVAVVLVEPCWSVCPELNGLPPNRSKVSLCAYFHPNHERLEAGNTRGPPETCKR